jgi:hypothetical protein
MSILELFCSVDDFWQHFAPTWQGSLLEMGQRQRLRPTQIVLATWVIRSHGLRNELIQGSNL